MSVDIDLNLTEKLFFPHIVVPNATTALQLMADNLRKNGFVTPEYAQALVKREIEYPTGLPVASPGIAIPHADYNLVRRTTLAVATLEHTVQFHNMEDVKKEVPVQIIIMMAIGEPHGQVTMLQRIVSVIQNDELRHQIIEQQTSHDLFELLAPKLSAD